MPMQSYTVAKKVEVIRWHRENGKNVHQTSRHFKLDRKRIREWEKNFDNLLQLNYGKAKLQRKLSNGAPVFSKHVDDALFDYLERERSAGRAPTTARAYRTSLLPSQVAIAAIVTDRERFVGEVHFQMASVKERKNTVANYFWKAGFVTAELAETGENDNEERIDDAFRKLSSLFPAAVPPKVSADDFVEADCNVQALVSLADEDIVAAAAGTQDAQADSSSGDEDCPDEAVATRAYSAADVTAAFGLICHCYGNMKGTGLSHLDSLDKIEAGEYDTDVLYVPAGCTSILQPTDVYWNKPFKSTLRRLWEQCMREEARTLKGNLKKPSQQHALDFVAKAAVYKHIREPEQNFAMLTGRVESLVLSIPWLFPKNTKWRYSNMLDPPAA
ncbi:hypothetical protein HPB52_000722 [Rhipicephalus sanguineus]|uniref:DDE-1 domain-containing protein n=1 Tax=Rhipicephalus sanguineus TaxID=34632 RepID=A0A9D4QG64_RHISA|nr:hypothetical protein HPB52_000722 [Rhipicephalus sanguineus]